MLSDFEREGKMHRVLLKSQIRLPSIYFGRNISSCIFSFCQKYAFYHRVVNLGNYLLTLDTQGTLDVSRKRNTYVQVSDVEWKEV